MIVLYVLLALAALVIWFLMSGWFVNIGWILKEVWRESKEKEKENEK